MIRPRMLTSLFAYGWALTPAQLALAAAVTLAFAVLARAVRGVNQSGAIAGGSCASCYLLARGREHSPGWERSFRDLGHHSIRLRPEAKIRISRTPRRTECESGTCKSMIAALSALRFAASGNRMAGCCCRRACRGRHRYGCERSWPIESPRCSDDYNRRKGARGNRWRNHHSRNGGRLWQAWRSPCSRREAECTPTMEIRIWVVSAFVGMLGDSLMGATSTAWVD